MAINLTNTPALEPPTGQVPNFDHPWSIQPAIYAFLIVSITLTALTTASRAYARFFVSRNAGWDDCTMILGWMLYVVYGVVLTRVTRHGAGVHQWDVRLVEIPNFAYWALMVEVLYAPVISVVKLSICLQLLRIFVTRRGREFWVVTVFIAIQMIWFLIFFCIAMSQCTPIQKLWDPSRSGTCVPWFGLYIVVVGGFNFVSDVLMLIYPLSLVSRLHLKQSKRIGIAAIFLVGSMSVVASIIRIVFSVLNFIHSEDETFALTSVALCTCAEIASGIIAGNMVSIPCFFKNARDKLKFASGRTWTNSMLRRRTSPKTSNTSDADVVHVETKDVAMYELRAVADRATTTQRLL